MGSASDGTINALFVSTLMWAELAPAGIAMLLQAATVACLATGVAVPVPEVIRKVWSICDKSNPSAASDARYAATVGFPAVLAFSESTSTRIYQYSYLTRRCASFTYSHLSMSFCLADTINMNYPNVTICDAIIYVLFNFIFANATI